MLTIRSSHLLTLLVLLLVVKFASSHLLNIFDLLYDGDVRCWCRRPSGLWEFFLQEEGFAQGCPFSPLFSALALCKILRKIQIDLDRRARNRLKIGEVGDDGFGSAWSPLSYMDDANACIPFVDLTFFFESLIEEGSPVGLNLKINANRRSAALSPSSQTVILTPP